MGFEKRFESDLIGELRKSRASEKNLEDYLTIGEIKFLAGTEIIIEYEGREISAKVKRSGYICCDGDKNNGKFDVVSNDEDKSFERISPVYGVNAIPESIKTCYLLAKISEGRYSLDEFRRIIQDKDKKK